MIVRRAGSTAGLAQGAGACLRAEIGGGHKQMKKIALYALALGLIGAVVVGCAPAEPAADGGTTAGAEAEKKEGE
jgi:hypothetical protein